MTHGALQYIKQGWAKGTSSSNVKEASSSFAFDRLLQ